LTEMSDMLGGSNKQILVLNLAVHVAAYNF